MRITVCTGVGCTQKGSDFILEDLAQLISKKDLEDSVTLVRRGCMGKCAQGVCVTVDGEFFSLSPSDTQDFFKEHILPHAK